MDFGDKIIVTHPANRPFIEQAIGQSLREGFEARVVFEPHMKREEPTGRIIAPDGSVAEPAGWSFQHDRFTTLEETDLPWLLALGLVREQMQPVIYVMTNPFLQPPALQPLYGESVLAKPLRMFQRLCRFNHA